MIEKARRIATEAHAGQKRKNSNEDYIVHPIRVAERLAAAGFGKEVVCAGYLHDVVEDTSVTQEDLEKEFGREVTALVAMHTEDKSKSWKERKQHTIDVVRSGSLEVKALIVADKLDNLQSIHNQLQAGEPVWDAFNAGYEHQKWYYTSVRDVMSENLDPELVPRYFDEYDRLVKKTFD
ncbi:bifunctional (p)ppGpp synthetase/guanosine-3',5'-bis(diphosphate) 3'-pyrophosphohydrolase [Halobacillus locisalis]|uniref:Bifunctional (P)ppGpp synthetase/guanosine-3',5'-bis(Diphosphate) 3'-pyrophosphohydrolase n=2 Tax=Halobacillus locisalis TaxID=220753 RepID=A0A838CX36_9BACI|nr:HD domain-containing protein [Halobacillus locisalis]MBA2176607.1 bifunctional (p)ppGpp synthetase/guanosine-3',5'-bis(diphosphate) 3'-pyrophosphohydrolase [Halobacillus locisalis]